jgi:hypothetical protein
MLSLSLARPSSHLPLPSFWFFSCFCLSSSASSARPSVSGGAVSHSAAESFVMSSCLHVRSLDSLPAQRAIDCEKAARWTVPTETKGARRAAMERTEFILCVWWWRGCWSFWVMR